MNWRGGDNDDGWIGLCFPINGALMFTCALIEMEVMVSCS